MNKSIKITVWVLLAIIVTSLFIVAKITFAEDKKTDDTIPFLVSHRQQAPKLPALFANQARTIIMRTDYAKHPKAIDWWINYIDSQIAWESKKPSSAISIEVTKASMDVQSYLAEAYELAGYHSELVPGWTGTDEHNRGGHPDGKTYLGLSW
jgi:hypothetical protein